MKKHSFQYRTGLVCLTLLGAVASLRADDLPHRIRIPNPLPRIAKGIEKVGHKVGNIFVRRAERIEQAVGEARAEARAEAEADARAEARERRPPPPDLLITPPAKPTGPSSPSVELAPLPPTSLSGPQPSHNANASASTTLATGPSYRPPTPSVAAAPSLPAPANGDAQPAASANAATPAGSAARPAPPPEPAFGKPVPGHPGLVYPPGLKEKPENMVDVRGIMPGTKVRDPETKSVFRVP